jgi:hypothetical protein
MVKSLPSWPIDHRWNQEVFDQMGSKDERFNRLDVACDAIPASSRVWVGGTAR